MTTNISSALGKAFGTLSASKILTAAAILVICLIIIRLLMKLIRRLVSQSKLDERRWGLWASPWPRRIFWETWPAAW